MKLYFPGKAPLDVSPDDITKLIQRGKLSLYDEKRQARLNPCAPACAWAQNEFVTARLPWPVLVTVKPADSSDGSRHRVSACMDLLKSYGLPQMFCGGMVVCGAQALPKMVLCETSAEGSCPPADQCVTGSRPGNPNRVVTGSIAGETKGYQSNIATMTAGDGIGEFFMGMGNRFGGETPAACPEPRIPPSHLLVTHEQCGGDECLSFSNQSPRIVAYPEIGSPAASDSRPSP